MDMQSPDDIAANAVRIDLDEPTASPAPRSKPVPDFTFKRTNTETIMATVFPEMKWIVPGYVPEGFSVLAGRQKLGKTWLAIDMALAVATGGSAIGKVQCEQGDVLYVDLENGERRIQSRINTFYPNEQKRPDTSRLEWVTEAPTLDKGFIPACEKWRKSVEAPRLIVIDVLQRVKPAGNASRNAYENDYATFADLQTWATTNGIAVLALHHTKKGGADDPLEALSGSNGLSACADTTLVLDRDSNGITLYVRGRDVPEIESALQFTDGLWSIMGEAAEVRRSGERNKILAALRDQTEPMSPNVTADVTGMKSGNVRKLLFAMAKVGEVLKRGRGAYIHPENATKWPADPENTGFKGKVTDTEPDGVTPGNNGNNGNFEDNLVDAEARFRERQRTKVTDVTDVTGV